MRALPIHELPAIVFSALGAGLLAIATAEEIPTNTTFETAAPLVFEDEALLVPSFHLAGEQWWRWMAPRDGLFTVTAPFAALSVRTEMHTVGGHGLPLSFAVTQGTQYFIRALADVPVEVFFRFDAPPNDHFANAIVLEESDTISTTIRGSSLEPNEPPVNQNAARSIWWRWTPSRDGALRLPPTFWVFHGDALETLEYVQPDDYNWVVRGGVTYSIAFTSTGLTETRVALRPGPRHGSFAERLRLGSDRSIRKRVFLPRAFGFQDPYIPATWWEWEAPADGRLLIEMSGYLQVRRYLIDGVENLILEEGDTVTAGGLWCAAQKAGSSGGVGSHLGMVWPAFPAGRCFQSFRARTFQT